MSKTKAELAPLETDFAGLYPFPLDDFQIEAIDHIRQGQSVMVAAPTSAGKTIVAEFALWRTLRSGKRAVYTTPIKALSNQKRHDLEKIFPGRVGLLTGDRSENREAPVLVMTTEVLRNMLLDDPEALREVETVVFDEVHYLADRDRGTIWEESIIMCLPHIQLVCLSATIANAEEISAWISQTHRPIALVRHDDRPVPLEHYAFAGGALRLIRDSEGNRVRSMPHVDGRKRRKAALAHPEDVIRALRKADLLPAIWFAFTRQGVEADAERCTEGSPPVTGAKAVAIESAIAWTLSAIPKEDRDLDQIARLTEFLRHGVGFHHAGLLPPCKELVEDLFVRGHLQVVCATDTLSVGINMPARTVVISSMSRPVAGLLTSNDFSQLTGRAGRRGIDKRGAVVILSSPYHDFERSYAMLTGELEPVRSSFTLKYSTLISLFERDPSEDRVARLVRASLRQFQLYGDGGEAESELASVEAELATLPLPEEMVGHEDDLDQYLELQRRLTDEERGGSERKRGGRRNERGRVRRKERGRYSRAAEIRALVQAHPMHRLASDPAFVAATRERVELMRRRNRLRRLVTTLRLEREREAEKTARAVSMVLRRLGYVDDRGLKPKAAGLRSMVAPGGIVLSEMYHDGMLKRLSPVELAEVMSWFACDTDRRRYNSARLSPDLQYLRTGAEMVFRRINGLEEGQGIKLAQGPSNWFWGVARAWSEGQSIESILLSIEIGEGDIVSYLNKTIDLLDQFKGLLLEYGDYQMISRADAARRLLSRGLVAMIRGEAPPIEEEDRAVPVLA